MIRINDISFFSMIGPRPNQEDYIVASNDKTARVFVLCDGMGGHGHGEVASRTVAESVHAFLTELNPYEFTADNMQDALDFAIGQLAEVDTFNDVKAMGTTIVAVALNKMNVIVGHVGDSRCYIFSQNGTKKYRSHDHSLVQEAVEAEILTEEEAWKSPKKNVLTRCITSRSKSVKMEVDTLRVDNGDVLMLCSDGVTDALRDSQLQSLMAFGDFGNIVESIKGECSVSSHDNFSAIFMSFSQDEKYKDSKVIQHLEKYSSVTKFCPRCGREMTLNAKFCPDCGLGNHQQDVKEIDRPDCLMPEKSLANRLREVNPLWLIVGGTILGGIIFWGAVSCFDKSTVIKQDGDRLPLNMNGLPESEVSSFISEICSVDSINAPADTLLSKHFIQEEYKAFIDSIQHN